MKKTYFLIFVLIPFLTLTAQRKSPDAGLPKAPKPMITPKFNNASGARKAGSHSSTTNKRNDGNNRVSTQRQTLGSVNSLQKKEIAINRTLQQKQGDFTFPFKSTRSEADKLGENYVGSNYSKSRTGNAWINANGDKQYRPASWKPKLNKYQANFDRGTKDPKTGKMIWISRGHLDIKD